MQVYIFSRQMEAIVFIILQIFFETRAVLKIGEYSWIFPNFNWGILGQVTLLDQLLASKKIWWIISFIILDYFFLPEFVKYWELLYKVLGWTAEYPATFLHVIE